MGTGSVQNAERSIHIGDAERSSGEDDFPYLAVWRQLGLGTDGDKVGQGAPSND